MVSKAVKGIQDAYRVREVIIWTRDGDLAVALYTIGKRSTNLYCDMRYVSASEFEKKRKQGLLD
jgi:hypothetical protein